MSEETSGASGENGFADAAKVFQEAHPDVEAVEMFVTDLNGAPRGKLLPIDSLAKLASGGARMPVSTLGLDVFGCDVGRSRIAIEIGDPDGAMIPAPESLAPMLWAERPSAQVIASLTEADRKTPAAFDPRAALARVAERAASLGLTPVMALEIEFYLIDLSRDAERRPQPPIPPGLSSRLFRSQIYDLAVLRAFDPLLAEIAEASRALGAPADAAICEFGPGQFEMNLTHTADAVAAADHLVCLKRAIRGVARKNGYDVTFMAKPYGEQSGSGLHVHLSLLDAEGRNIFDAGETAPAPNAALRHALGGLIATMPDGMAAFAPHYNSYRRFMPGSYAPTVAAWGLDNRGAALRCPEIRGKAARLEHRVAGADANAYLVAALVLAGALHGLETQADPGRPVEREAGASDGAPLPLTWAEAVARWVGSGFVRDTFGEPLHRIFAAMKRQEQETLLARVSDAEYDAYLRTV